MFEDPPSTEEFQKLVQDREGSFEHPFLLHIGPGASRDPRTVRCELVRTLWIPESKLGRLGPNRDRDSRILTKENRL